jgi:hypothetical protein
VPFALASVSANRHSASLRVIYSGTMSAPPTEYATSQNGTPRIVRIIVRSGVDQGFVDRLTSSLADVGWHEVKHAYGEASNLPALLFAVVVGTDEVRPPAWWELWGSIHHQGTVYEATAPSIPFIETIASSAEHPDRVEALAFLREIAVGNGPYANDVRAAIRPGAEALLAGWETEPDLIRRALIWLASAFPDLASQHRELVRLVPKAMQTAWDEVVARSGYPIAEQDYSTDEATDREDELARWALAGWPSA